MSINPLSWGLWSAYDLALMGLVIAVSNFMGYLTLESTGMVALTALVTVPVVGAVKEYFVG